MAQGPGEPLEQQLQMPLEQQLQMPLEQQLQMPLEQQLQMPPQQLQIPVGSLAGAATATPGAGEMNAAYKVSPSLHWPGLLWRLCARVCGCVCGAVGEQLSGA